MTVGLTIAQRRAAGKTGVPVGADSVVFMRASDNKELVGLFSDIVGIVTAATQLVPTSQQSGNYTAVLADVFSLIEFVGAGTQILSLPTDAAQPLIGVGSVVAFSQIGAGAVTWPAGITPGTPSLVGGVTYDVPSGLSIVRFVTYQWRKRAASEWVLS